MFEDELVRSQLAAVGAGPGDVVAGQAPGALLHADLAYDKAAGAFPAEPNFAFTTGAGVDLFSRCHPACARYFFGF